MDDQIRTLTANLRQAAITIWPGAKVVALTAMVIIAWAVVDAGDIAVRGIRAIAAMTLEEQAWLLSASVTTLLMGQAYFACMRHYRDRERDADTQDTFADLVPVRLRSHLAWLERTYRNPQFIEWSASRANPSHRRRQLRANAARDLRLWVDGVGRSSRDVSLHEAAHAVTAHQLGCTVIEVNVRPGPSGDGQTRYVEPLPRRSPANASWTLMTVALAGLTIEQDLQSGAAAARNDIQTAMVHATTLVALAWRPAGFEGPMTADALIAAGRARAATIVEDHLQIIESVALELEKKGSLGNHEFLAHIPAQDEVLAA